MSKTNKHAPPKKSSIILAWILLIILISSALTLTYLKKFGPNDNLEERPVTNKTSPVIAESLQKIVDNFNNSKLQNAYKDKNINIKATLNDTTIIIDYTTTITKTYKFIFSNPILTATIDNNDITNFSDVYKILIYACQERLNNNNNNIDKYINDFIANNTKVVGLSQKKGETTVSYGIDISKVIYNENTYTNNENNNHTTTTNNNIETNENGI